MQPHPIFCKSLRELPQSVCSFLFSHLTILEWRQWSHLMFNQSIETLGFVPPFLLKTSMGENFWSAPSLPLKTFQFFSCARPIPFSSVAIFRTRGSQCVQFFWILIVRTRKRDLPAAANLLGFTFPTLLNCTACLDLNHQIRHKIKMTLH